MATLRLKRLQIDRFRNVAPGTVLVFNDGKNVLLGPNGSGKTTLLRLIAAVVRDEFKSLAEEELEISYELELPSVLLDIRLINRRDSSRRAVPGHGDQVDWEFRVSGVAADGAKLLLVEGTPFGVKDAISQAHYAVQDPVRERGPLAQVADILAEQVLNSPHESAPDLPSPGLAAVYYLFHGAHELLESRLLSLVSQGGRFDEALGTFSAMVGFAGIPQTEEGAIASLLRGGDVSGRFVPDELRQAVVTLPPEGADNDIVLADDALPFLRRAVHLIGARQAKMILRLKKRSREGLKEFSDFEFLFTLDDGAVIRHDLLSWGQKRILSFFYYAAANPDILVVDELVNGLHHEWIAACLKEMEGRQCFLTSQNPLLLDQLVFSSTEDVRQTFIQCRREKSERRAELHWHPMDEASAESFFRAYRVGIQHVGEILRTKGLW